MSFFKEIYALPNSLKKVNSFKGVREEYSSCELNFEEEEITLESDLFPTELFYQYWPKEDYPCLYEIFYKFLDINSLDVNSVIKADSKIKMLTPALYGSNLKEVIIKGEYETSLTITDQKTIIKNAIGSKLNTLHLAYNNAIGQLKTALDKETLEFIPDYYDLFMENLFDSFLKSVTLTFKSGISSNKGVKAVVDSVYSAFLSTDKSIKEKESRNLKKISKNADLDFISESVDIVKDMRVELEGKLIDLVNTDSDWTNEVYLSWMNYLDTINKFSLSYSNLIDLDLTLNYINARGGYCDFVFDSDKRITENCSELRYHLSFISIGNTGHNHALSSHLNKLFFKSGEVNSLWDFYYKEKIKTKLENHIPIYILNIPVRIRFIDDYRLPIYFDSNKTIIKTKVSVKYPVKRETLSPDREGSNYYLDNHFCLKSSDFFVIDKFDCPLPVPYKFDKVMDYDE